MEKKTIQTEVDRLVSLVQEEGKISTKNAAKKLNMPISIISEWASFLEEEGIINIEYKFTTPLLVKRKLTMEQIEQIKDRVKEEKSIFERKSESTLNYLNKLEIEVNLLKEIFNELGTDFKTRVSDVERKFSQLKKAEEEKEKLNKHIIESKQRFMKNIADINKQLLKEQANCKTIYDLLYNQSCIESQTLDIQENELKLIKETDRILNKKLKGLKKRIDKKRLAELKKKDKLNYESESNILALEKKYEKLKERLDSEKAIIEELIKENQEQEKQTELLKKDVLSKIRASSSNIDTTLKDMGEVPKKLRLLMRKKDKILKILNGIRYNEKMLKEKLIDLMKKGSALNLAGNSDSIISEIENLEQSIGEISNKRGFFEAEIKKIFGLLRS